jgi:hypothetical protein
MADETLPPAAPDLGQAAYEAELVWLNEIMPGGKSPQWGELDPEHREVYARIDRAVRDAIAAEASQLRQRPGDQQLPVPNDGPSMHDLVIADLERWPVRESTRDAIRELLSERKRLGLERYGSLLQSGNGRDWMQDLREECADALVYARQGLEELGGGPAYAEVWRAYRRILSALVHLQEIPGGPS